MFKKIFTNCFLLCVALSFNQPLCLAENGNDNKKPDILKNIHIKYGVTTRYDDNVFRYSLRDRNRFKDEANPNRFKGVKKLYDIITAPSLELYLDQELLQGKPTTFRAGFNYSIYAINTERNYQVYSFGIEQPMWQGGSLKVLYYWRPKYFLRTLDDTDLPGSQKARYKRAEYVQHYIFTRLRQRLSQEFVGVIKYSYKRRDYNSEFTERDSNIHIAAADLIYDLNDWIQAKLGFIFETLDARAEDDFADVDDDVSYDQYGAIAQIRLQVAKPVWFRVRYLYNYRDYTTGNSASVDPFHAGRHDHYHNIYGRMVYEPKKDFEIFAEYTFRIKKSNLDEEVSGDYSSDSLKYQANIVTVGFSHKF